MEAALMSATVSGTLKIVGNKLAPLLIEKYISIVGVAKDLQELHGQVEVINNWLEMVGDKTVGNDASFDWLKKLKDISYDVDDLVDELHMEASKNDGDGDCGIVSKYLLTKPKSFIFQCKAASKIKAIKKRFDAIVKQRTEFSAIANSLTVGHPFHHINKTTVAMPSLPVVDAASVFGRDKEKHKIISKLVETKDQQRMKIVSIVGLGGSGKTTLAKLVFNDDNIIKQHFGVKLWVHVSQEFNVGNLVKKLFEAFADNNPGRHALPHMSKTILEKLTEKRFLLVLDDVWTEDQIQWKEFMVHLQSGAHGSRILLTTRSRKIAEVAESANLFDLPFLSGVESWQVFEESFGMSAKSLGPEFLEVGKDIVNKCGGVPLAIKVFAGVLRDKKRIQEWQAMRDSNLLDVEDEEHRVSTCLRLSYFHLPSHLKHCFTICSLFPKGHWIDKEQLVDQWIAHDMIIPEDGADYLEHIGDKCFSSLVQMSFLQDVDESHDGRMICRMHDLVHDLARSILGDQISLVPEAATSSTKNYRYFCLTEQPRNLLSKNLFKKARAMYVSIGDDFKFGKALQNAKHQRCITMESLYTRGIPTAIMEIENLRHLSISEYKSKALPEAISDIWGLQALHVTSSDILELPKSIGKLQKLRTLNLSDCYGLKSLLDSIGDYDMISIINLCKCEELAVLPNSIGRNRSLRVLRLGYTKIKRLPSSITALGNLECLDLRSCVSLVELPEGIWNLEKLHGLNLEGCNNLESMPVGIGQLSRLQNLSTFVVGQGKKSARILELANLARNSVYLTVRGIAHVMDPEDAHRACLKQMTHVQWLRLLYWRRYVVYEVNYEMEQAVLDGLEPPPGIKGLEISWYAGEKYTRWMLKQVVTGVQGPPQFTCLTTMNLQNFPNLRHLEGLVELPCLEEHELHDMPALESISGGLFPSLVKLCIFGMPRLGEVWMVTKRTLLADEEGGTCNHRNRITWEKCKLVLVYHIYMYTDVLN